VLLEPERILRLETTPVVFLDQRLLPLEEVDVRLRGTAAAVARAIQTMVVRGAPAIGVAAAYGIALAAANGEDLEEADRVLRESRRPPSISPGHSTRCATTRRASTRVASTRTKSSAASGCSAHRGAARAGTRALTHCNAGGLATGVATEVAVGALLTAWERGLLEHVWVDETGRSSRAHG